MIERLLRLTARKNAPMSGLRMGPSWRVVSPSGGSTLMTSAPRSPSCCAAQGPRTTVLQSTTRTPLNGPDMARSYPARRPGLRSLAYAKNALQLVGWRDFQLIVTAVVRGLVGTPAQEMSGVP